jgi:hypothetical protein
MPIIRGATIEGATVRSAGNPPPISGFTQQGVIGPAQDWRLSFAGSTLYAMSQSIFLDGTGTIFHSTNGGVTWTQGASVTGSASSYGFDLLALSDTTVIAQQRASIFRSTNSGTSFTNILNATFPGQNNFFNIGSDGVYGLCSGYNQNIISNDNWVTATTSASQLGFSLMASCALTNNGSNRFLFAGFGSSGSPAQAYVATNSGGSAVGPIAVLGNQSFVASNPTTGFNAIVSAPEGGGALAVYYATYPGTSYSTANISGLNLTRSGQPCISPSGTIIVPMTNGVWSVTTSGAPTQISALTDVVATTSDYAGGYVYLIRGNGTVYRWAP